MSLTGTDEESIQAEREAGRDMAKQLTREAYPVDRDSACTRLVQSLGAELAEHVRDKRRRFDFLVVKSERANAFALPGGFVLITRPLLELCESNRGEIAGVVGHEMAHVILFHARERVLSGTAFSALTRLVGLSDLVRRLAHEFSEQAYSQEQEFEADRLGIRLMAAAGYSPEAFVRALQRLEPLSAPGTNGLGSYLASHPPMAERIRKIGR